MAIVRSLLTGWEHLPFHQDKYQMKTLVIVPTYNEQGNILPLLEGIMNNTHQNVDVLFVDDSSSDGSLEEIKQAQTLYGQEKIHCEIRPQKLGLGSAYIHGFQWALAHDYEFMIEMDADLSHPATVLPAMIQAAIKNDVVIGSRYISGGGVDNWGFVRKMISRFGSKYARMILGINVRDLTGGFNGWRRLVIEKIDLEKVQSEGYSFQIEMKYRALKKGFNAVEIPIIFIERKHGNSKMSLKIIVEAFYRVWLFRFQKI